jgi:hypothetical protein
MDPYNRLKKSLIVLESKSGNDLKEYKFLKKRLAELERILTRPLTLETLFMT